MPDASLLTSLFPDEVVTRAQVRDVELPGGAGTMALITLDNGRDHTRPNTFGPAGLLSLNDALDAVAARTDIAAVGVTGKPFIFAVGADLSGAPLIAARDEALTIARLGHAVFRRLGELSVPSFAFVNGAALGGGLELALHCSYRTISSGVTAAAFPECFLGLLPGWGGTYLLPHLIGPGNALKVIVENPLSQNRMLRGAQAYSLGIADAMFEPADFLAESLRWAARVLTGSAEVSRAVPADGWDAASWDQSVSAARLFADGKLHGAAPAPYRAIDLVAAARGRTRDDGFAAEDEALADLLLSEELRAGLYAFDLTQKRARHAAGAPDPSLARPVTKIGVVGAGLMAAQIALLFARRLEVPVVLTDLDQARLDAGLGHVRAEVARLRERGRISADAAARLTALVTGSLTKDAFADADFVIEAVFEEMAAKQRVLAEVEAVVRPDCVLATNTFLAVGDRDGIGAGASRAGRRIPLLQPGGHDAAGRGGPGHRHRRRDRRHRARRRRPGEEELRAGQGRAGLRGQPPADPVPRRDPRLRRRRHAVRGGRTRARPAGPAHVPVLPAPAGWPGGRAARGGDAGRGLPGPVRALAQAPCAGRGGQDRRLPARPHHRRIGRGAAGRR
jgi:enoyl-CoA hydratase/carnithine racemase